MMTNHSALLIIDVQYDFLPGGSLQVPNGDSIIPRIVEISKQFNTIVLTQDWHPKGQKSFASGHYGKNPFEQINWMGHLETLWPDHCIQKTKGAEIHPEILNLPFDIIFRKGLNPEIDSYSAFYDNHKLTDTGLDKWLKQKKIKELYVCGLATDFCVKYSVLDAQDLGYKVHVLTSAVRGVNISEGDDEKALQEMVLAGAILE